MTRHSFPAENLVSRILVVRGQRVMLDSDLAELYGTSTKVMVQAVKRNLSRFPSDFMLLLTDQDVAILRSQIVTSSSALPQWGGRRWPTYAFTEQGVAMLSSILRSRRAVEVNIAIMRTFVQLRRLMDSNRELARKIEAMERKYGEIPRRVRRDQAAHRRRQRAKSESKSPHWLHLLILSCRS